MVNLVKSFVILVSSSLFLDWTSHKIKLFFPTQVYRKCHLIKVIPLYLFQSLYGFRGYNLVVPFHFILMVFFARIYSGNEEGGWIIPLSWKTVYGPPPDMSLF